MKRWLLATLPLLLAAGCKDASVPPPSPEMLAKGRAVYNFRCYFCHGYSGDAKTLAATYLSPPPRSFVTSSPAELPVERIAAAVREGRNGTGMKPFRTVISEDEIAAVAAFVFDEFVRRKAPNTRYHTPENGWADHEKYRAAYPFAKGEISLGQPAESLSPEQREGRRLYLSSCISCHDRGKPDDEAMRWESRPLSYPRFNYDHKNPQVDATTSATPYRLHDVAPELQNPSPAQKRGETLFQQNCAFCHAADGTGKNWIGSFLEPHPRNLTDPAFIGNTNRRHLREVIRLGLKETSMPAWGTVLSAQDIDDVIAYIDKAFHPVAD